MFSSVNLRAPDVVSGVGALQGSRVLLTGLSSRCGVDTAQVFSERAAMMALYASETSQEMVELAAHLGQGDCDLRLFGLADGDCKGVVAFAKRAAQDMGGIDTAVNFASFDDHDVALLNQGFDLEAVVAKKLEPLFAVTEVVLNRMRLTMTEGSVLNVVTLAGSRTRALSIIGDVARSMLGDVTRGLACDWAAHGIRINAVAPPASVSAQLTGSTSPSSQDVAELAIYLASDADARAVSGHLLDVEGYATRSC